MADIVGNLHPKRKEPMLKRQPKTNFSRASFALNEKGQGSLQKTWSRTLKTVFASPS
jgi:hypothetical protein